MRNDLIESAVSFLSSPNVQNAEKEKKIQFLKNKGLTDEEIEEAFKRTTTTTTMKPKVPSRLPYQIVYYSTEPTIIRMSTQQLLRYAILLGMGTLSVTVVLLTIVKKFMSRVFNSIAKYQSDRYKDHTDVLKRIEAKLREHASSTHESLIKEQSHLNSGLHRLLSLPNIDRIKNRSEYKTLRSIVDDFQMAITKTAYTNNFSYSGFTPSYSSRLPYDDQDTAIQSLKSEIRSFKGTLLSRRNFPTISTSPVTSNVPSPIVTTTTESPASVPDAYHPRRKRSFRSELPSSAQVEKSED